MVVVALAVLYFVPFGWAPASFHFMHANVFHLIANMIAAKAVVRHADRLVAGWMVSSVLVSFASSQIVGFSAVLFFILGSHFVGQMRFSSSRMVLLANVIMIFFFSFLIPNMTFYMHFAPFVAGALFTFSRDLYRSVRRDLNDASF